MAGSAAGSVFQIGDGVLFLVAVFNRQAHAVALGDLLTDGFEAGIGNIAFIAVSAGGGTGEAPVAVAAKAVVIVQQGHVLGQQVGALGVHQHGDGGGRADHVAVIGVTGHLGNSGGVQQHRRRGLHGLFGIGALALPVGIVGVLPGGGQQAQRRHCLAILSGVEHHLQLEGGGGELAAGVQRTVAAAVEGIGKGPAVIFLAVLAGMAVLAIGAVAGDVGAPGTPAQPVGPAVVGIAVPVGPTVIFGQIHASKDLHPGAHGGVGVPGGHQIVKRLGGFEHRGEVDGLAGFLHAQGAVAQLVGKGQSKQLTGGKTCVIGDLNMVADNRNGSVGRVDLFHISSLLHGS